jgi:hypothetical protein
MTKMNRRKHHRPVATRYNCEEDEASRTHQLWGKFADA